MTGTGMANRLKYSVAIGPNLSDSYPAVFRKDLYENVKDVARSGCAFAELHVRSPDLVDSDRLLQCCVENHVQISSISTGMGFAAEGLSLIDDDAEVRRNACVRLEGMIELAGKLGSSVIIGLLRGRIPDLSRYSIFEERLTESLQILLEKAERFDVNLDLEAISHILCNYFNTTYEVLEYVTRIGNQRLRILLDTYHMNLEDRDFARCVEDCGDRLAYVHYSDSNRRRPGAGNFDFVTMTRSLRGIGFKGFIGFEYIPSSRPFDELTTTLDYVDAIERMLDAEA